MRCSESSELMNTLKECYWSANLILWAHVLMEEYGMGRTEKQLSGGGGEASLCWYSLLPGDAFDDVFGKQRKQNSLEFRLGNQKLKVVR